MTHPVRWYPAPPSGFARLRVGLLGGSFNPAHAGHLHVSAIALRRLGLDEVWWLVSPQNPLKPERGMAPLDERLEAAARAVGPGPAPGPGGRIRVTDIEASLGTSYTAESLARLTRRFPRIRFVWLMGADNLVQLPRWKDWPQIFNTMPVAVIARPSYSVRALAGAAARRFARSRRREAASRYIPGSEPPAWVFLHARLHPASATAIRARREARQDETE